MAAGGAAAGGSGKFILTVREPIDLSVTYNSFVSLISSRGSRTWNMHESEDSVVLLLGWPSGDSLEGEVSVELAEELVQECLN